jgi:hypothetical protein
MMNGDLQNARDPESVGRVVNNECSVGASHGESGARSRTGRTEKTVISNYATGLSSRSAPYSLRGRART